MSTKLTIEDMHQTAKKKGGKCLSTTYINANDKLHWECANEHDWWATPGSVRNGKWCRQCQLNTVSDMKKLAAKHGGECLSEEYINPLTPLQWSCMYEHTWWMRPAYVEQGSWCKECLKTYKKLEIFWQLYKIAKERGGILRSKEFIRIDEKLDWECAEGHRWLGTPNDVKNCESWCPACAKTARGSIEEMQQVALSRGGLCLSEKYNSIFDILQWQCSKGHQWQGRANDVKNCKSWCPYCNIGFNQEFCRRYLEAISGYKFIMINPDWLRNIDGKDKRSNLQLDGYCAELNLAFEYNGEQHYKKINFHHKPDQQQKNDLATQRKNDKLKIELCNKNNTKLIIIPYWESKNLSIFINKECEKFGIDINININMDKITRAIYT